MAATISDTSWGDIDKSDLGSRIAAAYAAGHLTRAQVQDAYAYVPPGAFQKHDGQSVFRYSQAWGPHHELHGTTLVLNRAGVHAAAAALAGARGAPALPAAALATAKRHIRRHYAALGEDAPPALGKAADADPWHNFIPLQKIDAVNQEVWGAMVTETPDEDGEVLDYLTSKPLIEQWSAGFATRTGGRSLGNVRLMHQKRVVGKVIALRCDDLAKAVPVGVRITDREIWADIQDGLYTGFSIGGRRVGRSWPDASNPRLVRYTGRPLELSIVDNPCIPDATFELVKAGGAVELRKFATVEKAPMDEPVSGPQEETPTTAHAAAVEERADAEADHDPTVEVPVDVLAEWHRIAVALGAHYQPDPPDSPLALALVTLHAGLVAYCPDCCTGGGLLGSPPVMEQSADAGDLAKAGKRLSAASMLHVAGIHKHAHALMGAEAHDDDHADAAAADDAGAADVEKTVTPADPPAPAPPSPELIALQQQVADLTAALTKAADAQSARDAQVASLTEQIAKIAAQPMPGGPVLLPGGGGVMEKTMSGEPGTAPDTRALQTKITRLEAAYAAEAVPVHKARIGRELMDARDELAALTGAA